MLESLSSNIIIKSPHLLEMSSSEKLCLQWNDFKENTTSSFRELREDIDFTDVTLVCEDGKQVEAHKVILTASSPFFMDILKRNKHPHPLIYMRGLKSENISAIVDFLYFGEANVLQDNLDSFLELAEELRLKGLTNGAGNSSKATESTFEVKPTYENAPIKTEKAIRRNTLPNVHNQIPANSNDRVVAITNNTKVSVEAANLDEQIKSMMTTTNVRSADGKGFITSCNICGKELPSRHMPQHIEANHITGVSHACDICGKTSRSRNALRTHKYSNHKTFVTGLDMVWAYTCSGSTEEIEYHNFRTRNGLRQHIDADHKKKVLK